MEGLSNLNTFPIDFLPQFAMFIRQEQISSILISAISQNGLKLEMLFQAQWQYFLPSIAGLINAEHMNYLKSDVSFATSLINNMNTFKMAIYYSREFSVLTIF